MGNSLDTFGGYDHPSPSSRSSTSSADLPVEPPFDHPKMKATATKRKAEDEEPSFSPAKKVYLETPKYIYEKMFMQGEGSDIIVRAIGQQWRLHKVYLKQCHYFKALFRGTWKDSDNGIVNLEVPDENITVKGLHSVLGSLYNNEIELDLADIESVLATASWLQLHSVIRRCGEEMKNNITKDNVLRFLKAAYTYGLPMVRDKALHHLKKNFYRLMKQREVIKELCQDAIVRLLSASDLMFLEGEIDLYKMVIVWIFLQHEPEAYSLSDEDFDKKLQDFIQNQASNEPGQLFFSNSAVFASLRLHSLVMSTASLKLIREDKIIPNEILNEIMIDQWQNMLKNEENQEENIEDVTADEFHVNSIRLGRMIESSPKCWRWTGFTNGMDLVVNYSRGGLTLKRNCISQVSPYSINMKPEKILHYRVILSNNKGDCLYDSQVQVVSLRPDQSVLIARLGDTVDLPISVHLQCLSSLSPPPPVLYVQNYLKERLEDVKVVQSATEELTNEKTSEDQLA